MFLERVVVAEDDLCVGDQHSRRFFLPMAGNIELFDNEEKIRNKVFDFFFATFVFG